VHRGLVLFFLQPQHKLRDRKTVRLTNNLVTLDLPANRARTAALQNLTNTCDVNHALFQWRTFRIRNPLQRVSLRVAVPFILVTIWF